MSAQDTSEKIISTTEKAVGTFVGTSNLTQKEIMARIQRLLREVDITADGTIKPNTSNLRLIRNLRNEISKMVLTDDYKKRLGKFLGTFSEVKGITDNLFDEFGKFKSNKQIFTEVLSLNQSLTAESLTGAGINQHVIEPVTSLVQKGVTSGMSISDLEDDLRIHILGDSKRLGGLERYTSQIARDALNQYSRNYNKAISDDLALEWYYYSGSVIRDTRSYCVERAGKYFHKKEVEDVPSDWAGRIPGTNSTSIFINAGGYNCRHIWMPVLINVVPVNVIDRARSMGYYRESPD